MYRSVNKRALIVILMLTLLCVSYACPLAQTGSIAGLVSRADDGEPVAFANILVVGTQVGAMSLKDGRFTIQGLPAGTYTIKVMMMGYKVEVRDNVVVTPGVETSLEFRLVETIVAEMPAIRVIDEKKMVYVDDTKSRFEMDEKQLEDMPVETVIDAVSLIPGFVKMGDELHSRGNRVNDNQVQINGISVDDPLDGTTVSVGILGVAGSEVITGGMDAEYGDAQAAVINITTREGGKNFGGEFRYFTDDFGRQDKTYTNYDRIGLGFGGPTWWESLRYYVSGEATFSDTENTTIEPRKEHKITDWLKFRERQTAYYNFQTKITYKTARAKAYGEAIVSRSQLDNYFNNWNVQGYVSQIYYFQRIVLAVDTDPPVMAFYGITRIDHGDWAEIDDPVKRERVLNIRPVVVIHEYRDAEGNPQEEYLYNFRAATIGGQDVIWDEAVTDPTTGTILSYRPWVLFSGFQYPYSEFKPFLRNPDGADSSFVTFNSATRTPEVVSNHVQFTLGFNHNVTSKLLYSVKLSRLQLSTRQSVVDESGNPKKPYEYLSAGLPTTLPNGAYLEGGISNANWYTDSANPYFVTGYDYPFYSDRRSLQYLMRADVTSHQFKGHRIKSGVQVIYNDLADDERVFPALRQFDQESGLYTQGLNVNIYRNFNAEGAVYAQDKWEYEGMVVNGGLRFEFFSTGNNTEILINNSEIDPDVDQWKYNLSPRLGFAFPITDRDKFFFHYGRFTQWPSRVYLFKTQEAVGSLGTLGNPNLEPMLTVSYQAGISHQFTDDIAGNFIVFNKDIYGQISSTRVTDDSTGIQSFRYVNQTYASSRGLEVSLEKRLTRRLGFEVYYTYSFADGVASDADFGRSAEGLTHLPTDELPLDWDQRHTFNVTLRLQDENEWGATAVYQYGSGLPWTPYDRFARLQDPMWENSRRLEPSHRLSIRGRKQFNIYGRELSLYFEGRNLLDDDILQPNGTAPTVFPAMNSGIEMDGGAYLTETGRYGGAYLQDVNDDGLDEFNPVYDPTIWEAHRVWRIGFGFAF